MITVNERQSGLFRAVLELTDTSAKDAGLYRIAAKNTIGESNGIININFDGRQTCAYLNVASD